MTLIKFNNHHSLPLDTTIVIKKNGTEVARGEMFDNRILEHIDINGKVRKGYVMYAEFNI